MSQPVAVINTPPMDLGHIRKRFEDLAEAKRKVALYRKNLAQWEAYAKELEREIARAMGNATSGVIDGRQVVAYEPREQFAHARFIKDHPELAEVFMRVAVKQELDWQSLLAAEPEIAGPYQTKIMRVLD
jgi:hypothetical protein